MGTKTKNQMTLVSEIKTPYNLNSISGAILHGGKIAQFVEHEKYDLYLILKHESETIFKFHIVKTMNQTLNSADFVWMGQFDSIESANHWIDLDVKFAKQYPES